jgi:hypothetical protein
MSPKFRSPNKCCLRWMTGHPDYMNHVCARDKDHAGRHICACGARKDPEKAKEKA